MRDHLETNNETKLEDELKIQRVKPKPQRCESFSNGSDQPCMDHFQVDQGNQLEPWSSWLT